MTLSITPSGGRIGPGAIIRIGSDLLTGTPPFVVAAHINDALSLPMVYGSIANNPTRAGVLMLGVDGPYYERTSHIHTLEAQVYGLADGAPIVLAASIRDVFGTLIDAGNISGYEWDAVSFILNIAYFTWQGGYYDERLDEILASVRRTYS